ncbi:MAG: PP2C family protein-serine/threonine phosphatase [Deltaproteobacteria bacterium]|nr:PP2C family protein-serine/threonine phosphatase [Deltaproteobacteria bacterium]
MVTTTITAEEWKSVLETHRLFKSINESIRSSDSSTTPLEVLKQIFHSYGVVCDGVASLYSSVESDSEYFLRMEHVDGETAYHIDLDSMPKGDGGFLKYLTTLTEPILYPDITGKITESDLRLLPWLAGMKTALVVPTMSITGESATTILFAYEVDAFNGEEVSRNIVLTYSMTNILLNMLLRRESDRVCRKLDEELENIGRIQREFLPRELPRLDGLEWAVYYATSTRASGDYYDFFMLPDNRIGVIIADVSGHGAPAAVVMAMTRLLLHTYPGEVSPPAEALKNINSLLVGNLLPGQFVTAFYSIIDPTGKQITYSNAGHCHPHLFRINGGCTETLKTRTGVPLGILENGGFEEGTASLERGDVIIYYTDGLREAMNDGKEMYGEKRLQRILKASYMRPAEDIKNAILADVLSFCEGAPLRDDLTIVVMKILE